jgi:hypothetical protein
VGDAGPETTDRFELLTLEDLLFERIVVREEKELPADLNPVTELEIVGVDVGSVQSD